MSRTCPLQCCDISFDGDFLIDDRRRCGSERIMRIAVPEVVELIDLVLQNNDVALAGPLHASGPVRSIRARGSNSTVDSEFGGVDGFLQRTVVGIGDSLLCGGDENCSLRSGILWREER